MAHTQDTDAARFPLVAFHAHPDDEALLMGLHDLMPPFKAILDTAQAGQMDELCRHFSDFHYLGQMLERMAMAIASGQIEVP